MFTDVLSENAEGFLMANPFVTRPRHHSRAERERRGLHHEVHSLTHPSITVGQHKGVTSGTLSRETDLCTPVLGQVA